MGPGEVVQGSVGDCGRGPLGAEGGPWLSGVGGGTVSQGVVGVSS